MPEAVVADYRLISYQDRRLAQAADYFCSIELAAMRYERGEESNTYRKFYGLSPTDPDLGNG